MSENNHYHYEEDFHAKDRKASRKERKIISAKDRSKYKKSDQDQLKKRKVSEPDNMDELSRGRVLAITPEGIIVDCEDKLYTCSLRGSLKQEKNRIKNLVAVGDFVRFSPKDTDLGTIDFVEERHSILSRADNLLRRKEQLIAVNIDQVLITCSVVLPPLKPFLIDRYIIAAKKGNMQPVIVINKIDLFDAPPSEVDPKLLEDEKELYEEFVIAYQKLDIPVLKVSAGTKEGIDELKNIMKGKASVFSGQSGVGKSSLINAVTGSSLRIGSIVEKTSKGAHTTTSSHLLPLDDGGFCIDTPGIKSFGVWDLSLDEMSEYFSEIYEIGKGCKFLDCTHQMEPGCAVKEAVEKNIISPLRFASYCALMTDLSQEHRHR